MYAQLTSNRGRRSTGCATCLKRRIKVIEARKYLYIKLIIIQCDESKPRCLHCAKRCIPCPGYPDWSDIAWKDQTAQAKRMVHRRAKKIPESKAVQPLHLPANTETTSQIPRVLPQDFEAYAINFFFDYYIVLPHESGAQLSYLECVYPLWKNMQKGSPLRFAIAAVASFMLEVWSELTPNVSLSWSRAHYMHALVALRSSLEHSDRLTDDMLLATLLLDMYEQLSSFLEAKPVESPHISGMVALGRQNPDLLLNNISPKLLLSFREQVVRRSLDDHSATESSLIFLPSSLDSVPQTPKMQLDNIQSDVALITIDTESFLSETSSTRAQDTVSRVRHLERIIDLDAKWKDWAASVPESWRPLELSGFVDIPRSVRAAGMYGDVCTVYKDVFVAHEFNRHECLRIRLQLLILRCISNFQDDRFLLHAQMARATIQTSADRICRTIPFMLGDRYQADRIDVQRQYPHSPQIPNLHHHFKHAAAFTGWFLSPALALLLSRDFELRPGQRQWVIHQMKRLKTIYITRSSDVT